MSIIYRICIPHSNRNYYDYVANDCTPSPGARVWVPFGKKTRLGIVLEQSTLSEVEPSLLKTILSVLDEQPLIPSALLALCQWVSQYYQSPLSEVIALALPKKYRLGEKVSLPRQNYYALALSAEEILKTIPKQAKKKRALVDFLAQQKKAISQAELQQQGFNANHWSNFVKEGSLACTEELSFPYSQHEQEAPAPLTLNEEQAIAVNTMQASLNSYRCFLLQGVTGSGKTEVYLQLIAKVLAQTQQVLILVPEIGLTPQLLARFKARFSEPMVVIHSNLNENERQTAWQLAADNLAKLVIGTRSAVFTPMPALGLIIIDEEHDASFKQMDSVRYSARDTALMRAYQANIPIVLGSATPSLESLHNCLHQKYELLTLKQRALSQTPMHYQLLDIRSQQLQEGLAGTTLSTIKRHLDLGNQVLVFINRRGYAPVLLCHHCTWIVDCPACDSHLTLHRQLGRLICHHCGQARAIPTMCPQCHNKELLPIGAGTQRIAAFLQEQFPTTSMVRIDRDEVRKKNSLALQLERINSGEAQLMVGTQMLAKGHHFPRLTLVVILDADAGFYSPDFRALERLGQLLIQVAGRAGRAEYPGEVLIQTHLPQHPLLNLLVQEGYEIFANTMLELRQQAQWPPFQHLALIRAQDKTASKVLQFLNQTKEQITHPGLQVLGPAPSPLARKAQQHRMQLLIKASSRKLLQESLTKLRQWLTISKSIPNVRWNVDVDPLDLS